MLSSIGFSRDQQDFYNNLLDYLKINKQYLLSGVSIVGPEVVVGGAGG